MENKFILLIVEGESDESFFGEYLFNKIDTLETEYDIEFLVTGGDKLTCKGRKKGENIVKDLLKSVKDTSKLTNDDFLMIIQITDLDGSYFDTEIHFQDDSSVIDKDGKPTYEYDDYIHKIRINPKSKDKTIGNWSRKRNRQDELSQLKTIEGIPYIFVYNSLYLEHVLISRLPRDYIEKENSIDRFLEYRPTYEEFKEFFDSVNPREDFYDSWVFIKDNDPSDFEAYSNVIHSFNLLDSISE